MSLILVKRFKVLVFGLANFANYNIMKVNFIYNVQTTVVWFFFFERTFGPSFDTLKIFGQFYLCEFGLGS